MCTTHDSRLGEFKLNAMCVVHVTCDVKILRHVDVLSWPTLIFYWFYEDEVHFTSGNLLKIFLRMFFNRNAFKNLYATKSKKVSVLLNFGKK